MNQVSINIEQKEGVITFNFLEMKEYLNNRLEEYRNAVFTDDSIKDAKKYTASLRKEQAAFKSRIADVKKEHMLPFEVFKEKADELVELYDKPIQFIDAQVKNFEDRRKAEKKEQISLIYNELAESVSDYISLEKIYNLKWENATFKVNEIKKEIGDLVASIKSAVETIYGMGSDACEKALNMYKVDLNLPNAITYINTYERQKAEIMLKEQERLKNEELERIRREERKKLEAEQRAKEELQALKAAAEEEKEKAVEQAKEETAQEVIESLMPELLGETVLYEYRISLTADAKTKLEIYLDSIGIDWEMI